MTMEAWIAIAAVLTSGAAAAATVAWKLGGIDRAVRDVREAVAQLFELYNDRQEVCAGHRAELARQDEKIEALKGRADKLNGN